MSETYAVVVAKVQHLFWVWGMVCSKELHLAKQGLYELETEEAKTGSIPTVVETADTQVVESLSLTAHLLPLTDLFFLSSSFF